MDESNDVFFAPDEQNAEASTDQLLEEARQLLDEASVPSEQAHSKTEPLYETLRKKGVWRRLPTLLSFVLPFFIAVISYLISMLYTDGTNMLLSSDGWHQYYPFLVALRDKLLSGGSLEYSWVVGMGSGYLSLFAYYLASPMYLLSVLIPLDLLPHYFTLLTIVKLSLAGLFMGWFLRLVYRRNDIAIPFFATMYAFCAWAVGYYWNIMWLDVFALLPLLIAGTVCLLRDGKFRLYIVALALSLWCNYYVAFFSCIFVLLCFIGFCICRWNGAKNFLRRFLRIGICTVIGVGIACLLLLPTLLAMQTTYSSISKDVHLFNLNIVSEAYGTFARHGDLLTMLTDETLPGIFSATRQVLTGLMPANIPTDMDGLPNVFCSFTAVMLSVYYFCCKKISKREKIFNLCLLSFLILSFILRSLDYVWHGFHFPNMLPYRFSFLFSFVLIAMAYRAFCFLDDFKLRHLFVILGVSAALFLNAYLVGKFGRVQQVVSLAVIAVMGLFFVMYYLQRRSKKPQTVYQRKYKRMCALLVMFIVVLLEMTASLCIGIDTVGLTSQYNSAGTMVYPQKNENMQALLSYLDTKQDDPLFYRTEVTGTQTLNDAALNGYNGVSIFNSSTNASFNRMSGSLGLASWVGSNRFIYYESSPFTNMMCGIKYLLDRTGSHYNTDYNALVAQSGDVNLLENRAFISLGFMTNSELGDFLADTSVNNPIWEQEEMFRLATGIEEPLYTHYTSDEFEKPLGASLRASGTSGTQYSYSVNDAETEYQDVAIIYTVEESGLYVATTLRPTKAESKFDVYCNGKKLYSLEGKVRALFCLGNFEKGDRLKFVYSVKSGESGHISLDLAKQNNAVFDAGFELLQDEPFVLTEFSDGYVKGTVEALSDGLFYTSIPYEPGWEAYVDGQRVTLCEGYDAKTEDVTISDTVICFALTEGSHEIELVYTAPGLHSGAIITVISLSAFIALCFILRKNPALLADLPVSEDRRQIKTSTFAACAAACTVVALAVMAFAVYGAKKGYPSFLGKFEADTVFVCLFAAFCIALSAALYLFSRFIRQLRAEKRSKPKEAEATEEIESFEEEAFSVFEEDDESI